MCTFVSEKIESRKYDSDNVNRLFGIPKQIIIGACVVRGLVE